MRQIKLHPSETQFALKCSCKDLKASGVLQTSAFDALLKILLTGHEGHRYDLERRDGTAQAKEAA